jgi:protease-4
VVDEIAKGLGTDAATVEAAMERAVMPSADLVALRLAKGVREWDEMKNALPRSKGEDAPTLLAASDYDRVPAEKVGLKGKKKIAVVHAQGMIAGDESGSDPLLGTIMGYKSVNHDLQAALDDDDVVGVILRVDSRGGESITSDRISRMVEVVDKKKPVVVSMVSTSPTAPGRLSPTATPSPDRSANSRASSRPRISTTNSASPKTGRGSAPTATSIPIIAPGLHPSSRR